MGSGLCQQHGDLAWSVIQLDDLEVPGLRLSFCSPFASVEGVTEGREMKQHAAGLGPAL